MGSISITVTVVSSKLHQNVGRSEIVIQRIKEILTNSLQTVIFADHFDLTHKVSLISLFVNEGSLFYVNSKAFTPLYLDEALLK